MLKLSRTERVWLARIVQGPRRVSHDGHAHHNDPTVRLAGKGLAEKPRPTMHHVLVITAAGVRAHGGR